MDRTDHSGRQGDEQDWDAGFEREVSYIGGMGDTLQGQLLIASATLTDPNFEKSVILVIQHNDEGAMGLVLNSMTPVPMAEAWGKVSDEPYAGDDKLHRGGPCPGPLMVLHNRAEHGQMQVGESVLGEQDELGEAAVQDIGGGSGGDGGTGVYFSTDKSLIAGVVKDPSATWLCFVGYAGWGQGQLEAELAEGSWLTLPATAEHVFLGEELPWGRLMSEADPESLPNRLDPRIVPDDPSLN
ncbi:MAG: YqgE/AlgH family protein [Planctomycetota bacterium]